MNSIKIYTSDVSSIKIGSSAVTSVYIGNDKVYPSQVPLKFYATYSDSTIYSAECDSDTALTSATTKAHTTSYTGMTTAEIGSSCVTSIGEQAFYNCSSLSSVTIPSSVTNIDPAAFYNCSNLQYVKVEAETPPTLGVVAFLGTNNCPIYVPIGTEEAYKTAWSEYRNRIQVQFDGKFYAKYDDDTTYSAECNSSSALTSGETRAHTTYNYRMTTAYVGDCVSSIGQNAFSMCLKLESVRLPNSITSIDNAAFFACYSLTSAAIPSGVTTISDNAYKGCSGITSVTIPNSVTSLGASAFEDCSGLTSVKLSSNITSINASTFSKCTSLSAIQIPNNITNIATFAFRNCTSLSALTIGNGVTTIGAYAFDHCTNLSKITCYATTPPTLGNQAFDNTNNCPIYVPCESLTAYQTAWSAYASRITCEQYGFYAEYSDNTIYTASCPHAYDKIITTATTQAHSTSYTAMTKAVIGDCVTSIGNSAFKNCWSLTSVTIPDSVKTMDMYCFDDCHSLTQVHIPSGVTKLYDFVFIRCSGLTSVTIPETVTEINQKAFRYCYSLTSITVESTTPPSLGTQAFADTNNCPIYVPPEAVETYKAASGWSTYASRIQAIT